MSPPLRWGGGLWGLQLVAGGLGGREKLLSQLSLSSE